MTHYSWRYAPSMPVPKIQSRDPECPLRVNAGIVSGYSDMAALGSIIRLGADGIARKGSDHNTVAFVGEPKKSCF